VTLDKAIRKLVDLTKQHFADEEKHMQSIGLPDSKRHALIQADMLRKVGEHYAAFTAGSGRVSQDLTCRREEPRSRVGASLGRADRAHCGPPLSPVRHRVEL
jgi:hypothetical protein